MSDIHSCETGGRINYRTQNDSSSAITLAGRSIFRQHINKVDEKCRNTQGI